MLAPFYIKAFGCVGMLASLALCSHVRIIRDSMHSKSISVEERYYGQQ